MILIRIFWYVTILTRSVYKWLPRRCAAHTLSRSRDLAWICNRPGIRPANLIQQGVTLHAISCTQRTPPAGESRGRRTTSSSSMERRHSRIWRKLGNWTRTRCRAPFDALIGLEAEPKADAGLVSNLRLRSISLRWRQDSSARASIILGGSALCTEAHKHLNWY